MAGYFSETAEGVVLNVRAQPRSSRSGVDGVVGDALKVRIRSAPVDGKANKELVETLADAFSLPKSRVSFAGGETSKNKRILLAGLGAAELRAAEEGGWKGR
ncbi:MAG: DUF167 domain-containing protein [Kiritimatiellae bacterium]|nr:DUF167 domain-containing protein [Kiritimatiellia bacterium]